MHYQRFTPFYFYMPVNYCGKNTILLATRLAYLNVISQDQKTQQDITLHIRGSLDDVHPGVGPLDH